ncbi:His-Xaa-Ser system radical SAM maturase HxsB [Candidatus Neomarinimicrobiota bacterium]
MSDLNNLRKFKDNGFFQSSNSDYFLLPFRFSKINNKHEVLVNEVGDFLIVPNGTATDLANRNLEKDSPLLADLYANFFIADKPIPDLIDIIATRYRTKKSFLDYFTGLHIFVITLRCEHTCNYCQVSRVTEDKNKYDMSYKDIDSAVNIMMAGPNPNITMEFQGGEPLLAFDKVQYAVKKAEESAKLKNKNIQFVICSNLAIVTPDILNFCKKHNILISTSLDGPKFIHDSNRNKPDNSSYDLAINGIRLARDILGHDMVSALMTTTQLSIKYPVEIVDEYFNNGFSNIFLRNISPYGFALRTEKNRYGTLEFLDFYKTALERIIEYNLRGNLFVEDFAKIILKKMLTPFNEGFVDLQSPSGIISGVIVYNYDGSVYASDESRMLGEQKDFTFKLGTLNNGYYNLFFGPKVQQISQYCINESLAGCSDCAYQTYCGADPVHNWATQKDMYGYRPTSDFCIKNMEIIRHLFNLIDKRGKDLMPIFNAWISNR